MKSLVIELMKRYMFAILLMTVATAALSQTPNESISVGSGTLSYTMTEVVSGTCSINSGGIRQPYYTYTFNGFSYAASGGTAETASGSTSYIQAPASGGMGPASGGACPTSGWQSPNPVILDFPGFVITFTASITGSSSATFQFNTLTQTNSSANPSMYGQGVTFTTLVTGGEAGGTITFEDGGNVVGSASATSVSTTNLVPYSQQIGNSSWGPYCGNTSSITLNSSNLLAPDGSQTATGITTPTSFSCVSSSAAWGAIGSIAGGLTAGTDYTVSVWMAGANGGEEVNLGLNDCAYRQITLTTTWTRYTVSFPASSTGLAGCGNGRGFQVLDPYGTNQTYYVWGAQTEASTSEGPYVATTASAASGTGAVATFTDSSLTLGAHSITGVYGGNSGSTVSPVIQIVNKAAPGVLFSCTPNSITYGSQTSCTASVGGSATGQVSWIVNGTTLTASQLSNGTASVGELAGDAVGSYSIQALYSGDTNNNSEYSNIATVNITQAQPSVTLSCTPNPITYGTQTSCTASVGGSATGQVSWIVNGTTLTSSQLSNGTASVGELAGDAVGSYSIQALYGGDTNNGSEYSNIATVNITQAQPSVTLSCTPNPITYGTQTSCTASVGGSATGQVSWIVNGTTLTSSQLSNGTASVGELAGDAVGSYSIQALYGGDTNNSSEHSNIATLNITQAKPSVTLSCTPNSITYGTQTSCTASVGGSATGQVSWIVNGTTLTSSQLSNGTASVGELAGDAVGSYSIQALYSGDTNNSSEYSNIATLTISKATPTVQLACTPNPITYDVQNTVCSATVSGNATGTVSFTINGNPWVTSALSGGTVSEKAFVGEPAGAYTIGATYNGDANNTTANAASTTLTISKAAPTVQLACTPNPITYDVQNTVCSATVSGNATGTVSFTINGNPWVTSALSGGTVSEKAFVGEPAGAYTIGATYNGDANNTTANATPTTLTISKATPTVQLACTPNPITYDVQNTVCSATVSGNATGTVSFTINGNPWVTSALSGGTVSEKAFVGEPAGAYTIGATYNGDANNTTANATSTTLTISKAAPTVQLACTPNPITYDVQNTVCSATVSGNATGTVSFTINGNPWVTSALSGGTVSEKAFVGEPAGAYTIGATYNGDANNTTANATPTTLTISKATPVISWASPGTITPTTPISATQLNATANVPGSFAYSVASGTVFSNGSYTLTTTFTPTDMTDYTTATKSVNLVVASSPTIIWSPPAAISYGTPLSAAQLNATANVPGSFTYSPAAGKVLAVGTYTLTAIFTPTSTQYSSVTTPVSFTVDQAAPPIVWTTPADITKGTALSAAQLNASTSVTGTITYSPALGTVLPVGPNVLTAIFTPKDTTDYSTATVHTYLTVTEGTNTWDSGTVALAVNGSTIATASYGKGSTPSTIAAALATAASSSLVNVTAVDSALYLKSKTAGVGSDYTYSLQTTSYDSSVFSQPSFAYPALAGSLDGGAALGANSGTNIYSYTVPTGGYDGAGNLLSYSDSSQGSAIMGEWTFNYDNLNRLTGATDNQNGNTSTNYCWSYDSFGNRTTQAGSNAPFSNAVTCAPASNASLVNTWATYAASNQLSATSQAVGGVPYDAAGNVLSDGVTQYLYDADGRVCASANSLATSMTGYIYDVNGSRVTKGTITAWSCDPGISGFHTLNDYVLGPNGEQVTEMGEDSSGTLAWQHTNVYGAGMLLATYDNDGLHFYANDPLGSRRAQTDYAGVMEQTCASLPFGDGLSCTGSTQFPTEHHFTGKERDTESGLDYFTARYYSSNMGRFTSPDSLLFNELRLINPQRWNMYAYVVNNPLTMTDPSGHDAIAVNFPADVHGLGHMGIVSVHSDGTATYSRFGPQSPGSPADVGEVRTDTDLPKVQFDSSGQPTDSSLHDLTQAVSKFEDYTGQVNMFYFKTSDAETAALDEYIKSATAASKRGQLNYVGPISTCATYCAIGLHRAGVNFRGALQFNIIPNIFAFNLFGTSDAVHGEKVTSRILPPDKKNDNQ